MSDRPTPANRIFAASVGRTDARKNPGHRSLLGSLANHNRAIMVIGVFWIVGSGDPRQKRYYLNLLHKNSGSPSLKLHSSKGVSAHDSSTQIFVARETDSFLDLQ